MLVALIVWQMSAIAKSLAQDSAPGNVDLPGQRPDGSVLLPNQWSLRPAGRQVDLGDFPVNIAVHPKGRLAAILHSGFGKHEIIVVDVDEARVVSRTPVHEAFYGLEFSRNGHHLYCSGAGDEVVHLFDFKDGKLTANKDIRLRDPKQRGIPCGLAVSRDERSLFVANVWGQTISHIDLPARTNRAEIALVADAITSTPVFINQAPVDPDLEAVTKRAEAALDPTKPDAPFPYGCRRRSRCRRPTRGRKTQKGMTRRSLRMKCRSPRWRISISRSFTSITREG